MNNFLKRCAFCILSSSLLINNFALASKAAKKQSKEVSTKSAPRDSAESEDQNTDQDASEDSEVYFTMNEYEIKGLPKDQKATYFEAMAVHLIALKSDSGEKYVAPSIADLDAISKNLVKWDLFIRSIDALCTTVKENEPVCKKLAQDRVSALRAGATH